MTGTGIKGYRWGGQHPRGAAIRRINAESHHSSRIEKVRYSIVRHDGILLGGSPSLESARRIAGVISTGQRKGYAEVRAR